MKDKNIQKLKELIDLFEQKLKQFKGKHYNETILKGSIDKYIEEIKRKKSWEKRIIKILKKEFKNHEAKIFFKIIFFNFH